MLAASLVGSPDAGVVGAAGSSWLASRSVLAQRCPQGTLLQTLRLQLLGKPDLLTRVMASIGVGCLRWLVGVGVPSRSEQSP